MEGKLEADVFIILAVVLINAVLGVFQESKAEKAIAHAKEVGAGWVVGIGNESAKKKIVGLGVDAYIHDFTEIDFHWFLNNSRNRD